eukprot:m51a1_g1416 putative low quality protein: tenascin-x (2078) ;mRNA; f:40510-48712
MLPRALLCLSVLVLGAHALSMTIDVEYPDPDTASGWTVGYHATSDKITCVGVFYSTDPTASWSGDSRPHADFSFWGSWTNKNAYMWVHYMNPYTHDASIDVVGSTTRSVVLSTSAKYTWVKVSSYERVSSSPFAYTIYLNFGGVFIDALYLTSSSSGSPSSTPDAGYNTDSDSVCYTTWDLPSVCLEAEWPDTITGTGLKAIVDNNAANGFAETSDSTSGITSTYSTAPKATYVTSVSGSLSPIIVAMQGRFIAPTTSSNALWVAVNGANHLWDFGSVTFTSYTWKTDPTPMVLNAGTNTIVLGKYDPGMTLDQVYFGVDTRSSTCSASNIRTTSDSCAIMNGGCSFLQSCSQSGSTITCGQCAVGYSTSGTTCTALLPRGGCSIDASATQKLFANTFFWPTTQFTAEIWIYVSSNPIAFDVFNYQAAYGVELSYDPSAAAGFGFIIAVGTSSMYTGVFAPVEQWIHVAVTYAKAAGTATLYINGAAQKTVTLGSTIITSYGNLSLVQASASGSTCAVLYDEFKVWSVAFSAAQVATLPMSTTCGTATNMVACWGFCPNADGTAYLDSTGNYFLVTVLTQKNGLAQFYWATNGDQWAYKTGWLSGSPCSGGKGVWFGVGCDSNDNVISLNLGYNNLGGTLPAAFFCSQPYMQFLFLQNNKISGTIPSTVNCLSATSHVYLFKNQFSGELPAAIGAFPSVQKLYIERNSISGTIPSMAGNSAMQYLGLANNAITGSVPGTLASAPKLVNLDASGNQMDGTLPSEIINSQIATLNMQNNKLYGQIPDRTTTSNDNMIVMNFSSQVSAGFSCMLPPWLRNANLKFQVSVKGADFYCPVGSVPPTVEGVQCTAVKLLSLSLTSIDVDKFTSPTITITGSGFKKAQCGSKLAVYVGASPVRTTVVSDTQISFPLPALAPQLTSVRLVWNGTYYNGEQLGEALAFKFFRLCPNNCNCPEGDSCTLDVCRGCCKDTISGVCQCKSGYTGTDCGMRTCPLNCSGSNGVCDPVTGTCSCYNGFTGPACNQKTYTCPLNCSGQGYCDIYTAKCLCAAKRWGDGCENIACPPYNNPPFCSAHGSCDGATGKCVCQNGWVGDLCNVPIHLCPNNCTSTARGYCDLTTGNCTCLKVGSVQYGGSDCSTVVCLKSCSSHGLCNTTSGLCQCYANWTALDCSVKNVACPGNCSGRGTCDSTQGVCYCDDKYTGDDCAKTKCPGVPECNSPHGTCNYNNGTCTCERNATGSYEYTGLWCTTKVYSCPDDCNANTSRGFCDPVTGQCHCTWPAIGTSCAQTQCASPKCSGHGSCDLNTGKCQCWEKYNVTADCSILSLQCSDDCDVMGGGFCDQTTGECKCYSGWGSGPAGPCTERVCSQNCNYPNGVCVNGTCACTSRYTGVVCAILNIDCPGNCSGGHGTCNRQTGKCSCYPGYEGEACELIPCTLFKNCSSHGTCDMSDGHCVCDNATGWQPPSCDINSCSHLNGCTSKTRGLCDTKRGVCNCVYPYYGDMCEYMWCTKNCSGHGACNHTTGKCSCNDTWQGTDCSAPVVPCLNGCSGHGICNTHNGTCKCYTRYYPPSDCSLKLCQPANCSGNGKCIDHNGTCQCNYGWSGPACATASRPCPGCSAHGRCNSWTGECVCNSGWSGANCTVAKCIPACLNGGVCNPTTAVCECPKPYGPPICAFKDLKCPSNCNNHGKCLDNSTCACYGSWQPPNCSWAACPGSCGAHGTCDTTRGVCVCESGYYGNLCQLANLPCKNNCWGHGTCQSTTGTCLCVGLWTTESDCRNSSCTENCSKHGDCDTSDGTCQCHQGWTGRICSVPYVPCTQSCGDHGHCNNQTGTCSCDPWYWGDQCQWQDCKRRCYAPGTVDPVCDTNTSTVCKCKTGVCTCNSDYNGTACSDRIKKECPGGCSGATCNTITGKCQCPAGKTRSPTCNETECPNLCSLHGDCNYTAGTCVCYSNYYGTDCRYKICPNNCSAHGICLTASGTCVCTEPYGGTDCSKKECPGKCNEDGGGGKCVDGKCVCRASYVGKHCESPNWTMIILVAVGGGAVLVGGSAAGFFFVRRAAIKRIQSKKAARMRAINRDAAPAE